MAGPRAVAVWAAATVAILLAAACGGKPSPEAAAFSDVIRGSQTAELNLDGQPELAKYYVATLLARKVAEHQDGLRRMAEAGAGGRVGGVRTLTLKDVQVSGETANVSAEVTVWFKTAQFSYQSVTSRPEVTNIIDLDLHLVKDGGTWKIDQEHWRFAPGGGP
jgi:hypothetical protein